MADSIDTEISNLLQRALKEGREDVANALRHLTPVSELAKSLATTLKPSAHFTDEWRGLLTRKTYGLLDGRALTSTALMQNGEYREFLLKKLQGLSGQESAHHLTHGLISAGLHSEALQGLSSDEEIKSFKAYFQQYLNNVLPHSQFLFYTETGQDHSNTRDTIKILDMLDLDFPSTFTPSNYPDPKNDNTKPWGDQRIEMNIELVGSVMTELKLSVPQLSTAPGGGYKWLEADLPAAVTLENQRVQKLGGWHKENFPRFLPVIVPESSLGDMLAQGAIPVCPLKTVHFTSNRGAGFDTTEPSREFVPVTPNHRVTDKDIRLAFSFFPPQLVTGLIENDSQSLVMIPLQTIPLLAPTSPNIADSLKAAVRFHRPELLISDQSRVTGDYTKNSPLPLYLKGFKIRQGEYSHLDITDNLSRHPDFIDSLLPAEVDKLAKYFVVKKEYGRDFNRFYVNEQSGLTTPENVALAKRSIEALTNAIGYPPAVHYRGSPEFIKALAEAKVYSCDRSIFSNHKNMSGDWYSTAEGVRCGGTIGETGGFGEYADMPFDELVIKGTRLKDPATGFNKQKQVILGILDRYPLEDVVGLAKTDAQYRFLMDNFDLMPVRHLLPKRLELVVAGKQFSSELGF
ncbi:hypothetical protein [Pseudomonas sp. PLMAX]|uniref:hypothetical protein n=1 Tax=Pseudomonas sp. PLMAX TaxID=2201998 RepID=UPI0038B99E59